MNALIAESLPLEIRGSGIAAYRTVTSMPMIITSTMGGVLMDYYGVVRGVRYIQIASLVVAIVSNLVYWKYIAETLDRPREDEGKAKPDSPRMVMLQGLGKMPREVWILTAVAALSTFAMRVMMSFMVVYAVEIVGLTKTQWGVIGTVVSEISTLLTMPAGMYADRVGRKPVIIVSRGLLALSTLGFTFSSDVWQMGLVRSVGGVARGFGGAFMGPMGGPVWQALVADVTPP